MSRAIAIRKNPIVKVESTGKIQSGVEWIVADVSASMDTREFGGAKSRLDCVNEMIKSYGEHIHVAAFENIVSLFVGPTTLTSGGSTQMELAFQAIKQYEPNYIVVLSDGCVDNQYLARESANALAQFAIIDTVYIGPDDERAESFMKELAEIGCGRYKRYDMSKPQTLQLTEVIQGLLPPPQEIVEV